MDDYCGNDKLPPSAAQRKHHRSQDRSVESMCLAAPILLLLLYSHPSLQERLYRSPPRNGLCVTVLAWKPLPTADAARIELYKSIYESSSFIGFIVQYRIILMLGYTCFGLFFFKSGNFGLGYVCTIAGRGGTHEVQLWNHHRTRRAIRPKLNG